MDTRYAPVLDWIPLFRRRDSQGTGWEQGIVGQTLPKLVCILHRDWYRAGTQKSANQPPLEELAQHIIEDYIKEPGDKWAVRTICELALHLRG